jgi:hypothetical protein
MKTIQEIYAGAERLINQIIRKEIVDQGHHLTGSMEDSLDYGVLDNGKEVIMEGFAVHYTKFVNDGVPAKSASMKQWPFLVEYFKLRGLPEKEAKGAAAATIKVWMKEGMSTQASKRFSKTGARQNMIESAFTGNEARIDQYMTDSFDFVVEEKFQQERSETI